MKISGQIEEIFAHAVALDQSGHLRNSIYAQDREVYILNFDHTVLLRFKLREKEPPFAHPIYFRANDYDSNEFYEEDGRVVFVKREGNIERKKICGRAEYEPEEIRQLFNHYASAKVPTDEVVLPKSILRLFNPDLSHIEFSGEKGEPLKMIQRNIYSGGIIEIQKKEKDEWAMVPLPKLKHNFGPVGMKTDDFKALFAFHDALKFQFPSDEQEEFILVKGMNREKRDMVGVIGCCMYDESIEIKEIKIHQPRRREIR